MTYPYESFFQFLCIHVLYSTVSDTCIHTRATLPTSIETSHGCSPLF